MANIWDAIFGSAITANKVLASPNGSPGPLSARALVAADIPNLPASIITSGTLALAQGGTNADLSATGGATFVLAQDGSHVVSARALIAADIPNLAASKITSGALALARGGTAVDLSATGSATAFLAQDGSHVVSARSLVTGDLPSGTVTGSSLTSGNFITGAGTSAVQDSTFPFFLDPSKYVYLYHDFVSGSVGGTVVSGGSPGFVTSVSGTGAVALISSETGTYGLVQLSSGATNASAAILTINGAATAGAPYNNVVFDAKFRIKVNSTTSCNYFLGFNKNEAVGDASTDFIGIGFASAADGTTWHLVQRAASGTAVRTNITGATVSTSAYQTLRIRCTTAGTILASVDGGGEVSINSGLPTVVLTPQIALATTAAANAITMKADYFFHWYTLTR